MWGNYAFSVTLVGLQDFYKREPPRLRDAAVDAKQYARLADAYRNGAIAAEVLTPLKSHQ
jgi:hypothetical protein